MPQTSTSVSPTTLRRCTLEDAETLALVGASTFLEAFAGVLDGPSILAHCLKNHSAGSYRTFLAEPRAGAWFAETVVGATPVGYVLLTEPDLPLPDLAPADLELKRIYLFSRFHGSGAAQQLMDQAITHAQSHGVPRLLLGVHRENSRGLRFYERNGFRPAGVRTFQIGRMLYDDLILARPL